MQNFELDIALNIQYTKTHELPVFHMSHHSHALEMDLMAFSYQVVKNFKRFVNLHVYLS